VDQRFTSNEVVALTGITPRQLQWWDERGIVRPARQGRVRVYSAGDLAEVAVICELRRRGFSLQRVRKVMRFLQREFGKRLLETVTAGSDYHLLTDGQRIYLETDAKQIIDILKNARQPMLTVCLTDALRRIGGDFHRISTKSARLEGIKSSEAANARTKRDSKVLPFASTGINDEPASLVQRRKTVGRR
jgi:DNA-binding transcriptional MerR regulator